MRTFTEPVEPIEAGTRFGDVVLVVSPDTARQLAGLWAVAHANDPARGQRRGDWAHEVVDVYEAAVRADMERGIPAPPNEPVPFVVVPIEEVLQ